jgi:hypothetical protein
MPDPPNISPPQPSGPPYSVRLALGCAPGNSPGPVLHALQELRSAIDDRLAAELGARYDRHRAESAGTNKLTVTFTLRAETPAAALRGAGIAAGALAEILTRHAVPIDLTGVALVVRATPDAH